MEFHLRPMEDKDLEVTFHWRNDSEVLRNAVSPEPISYNEHEALFKYNNAIKLVFEVDGVPVGFVSVTRDPDDPTTGEWSFHMSADHRGKGLSEIMLRATFYYMKTREGYNSLTSQVFRHNKISKHLHYKLGFDHVKDIGSLHQYYKAL